MHRILLYVLVLALMYLAWDARRGEVLAANREAAQFRAGALLASARAEPAAAPGELPATRVRSPLDRMEARVEERPDVWAQFELPGEQGPPAERVLTDAEQWLESSFPEGGRTLLASASEQARVMDFEVPPNGRSTPGNPPSPTTQGAGEAQGPEEAAPIYIASLARIESLDADLPAWFGLLDMALRPAGSSTDFRSSDLGVGTLRSGDTAWISDNLGRLVARVEALDGLGLELDSNWPWLVRQRRLFWTEGGTNGMPVRQYRLVFEGNSFRPSWSGRLVWMHTRAPAGTTQR